MNYNIISCWYHELQYYIMLISWITILYHVDILDDVDDNKVIKKNISKILIKSMALGYGYHSKKFNEKSNLLVI